MRRIEKTVFISYRRANSTAWARAVFIDLKSRGYDVFLDYQGIGAGGFEPIILENLRGRAHFLVLLAPGSLARCDQPGDWLRREIETAIETRRNIVPVLLDGFSFGSDETRRQLNGRLTVLPGYNGLNVPHDYFNEAMERLCRDYLSIPLEEVLHPISAEARDFAKAQQRAAEADTPRHVWMSDQGQDEYGEWAEFSVKGVVQRMRWIRPGEFLMGSPESEAQRETNETQHKVILTRGYWLADTACTQALWQAVMGNNPSGFKDDPRNPVEQVSWDDVVKDFLPKLNALVPGLAAELPTEAQWEYACRAGTQTAFWFGDQISTDQVNYDGNHPMPGGAKGQYREQTVPVKALPANGWGLHQMHGNVWEWCADWYGDYEPGAVTDPRGPGTGQGRVLRGGGWFYVARLCRSAVRGAGDPGDRSNFVGFRLSRGLAAPGAEP